MKRLFINFQPQRVILMFFLVAVLLSCKKKTDTVFLLNEDFSSQINGPLLTDPGAYTEFHYLPEARPRSNWVVSTYRYNLPPSWEVREKNSQKFMIQTKINHNVHWHPMIITGSPFWNNYTIEAEFKPDNMHTRSGIVFRYQNDRCYYF